MPTPETLKRWWDRLSLWLVGLGVVALLGSLGTTTFLAIQRDQTGRHILSLEQQVHTLVQQVHTQSQRSAKGTTEAVAIVKYLIGVDQSVCKAAAAVLPDLACPTPPKIP